MFEMIWQKGTFTLCTLGRTQNLAVCNGRGEFTFYIVREK